MVFPVKKESNKSCSFFADKRKIGIFLAVVFSLFSLLLLMDIFLQFFPTGWFILDLQPRFIEGEQIRGNVNLIFSAGELIPADSLVYFQLGSQERVFQLADLITSEKSSGNFYAENSYLSGNGEGYGLIGEKRENPVIEFKLKISSLNDNPEESIPSDPVDETTDNSSIVVDSSESPSDVLPVEPVSEVAPVETPVEPVSENSPSESSSDVPSDSSNSDSSSSENLITGAAISSQENIVSGSVSKGNDYIYNLVDGESYELVADSVSVNGESADSDLLRLVKEGNRLIVSTDYELIEKGFGKDFLGSKVLTLSVPLENLNLTAEENAPLNVNLIYQDNVLASVRKDLIVIADEKNETVEQPVSNISIVQIKDIPTIRIKSGENTSIDLSDYFSNAESYGFNVDNVSEVLDGNILTLIPQEGFKGSRKANIIAYRNNRQEILESNQFLILISSGAVNINVKQSNVRVGEVVKWTVSVSSDVVENISLDVPVSAENISVVKIDENGKETSIDAKLVKIGENGNEVVETVGSDEKFNSLTGNVIADVSVKRRDSFFISFFKNIFSITGRVVDNSVVLDTLQSAQLNIDASATNYTVEYYTEAPKIVEENISDGKEVTVYTNSELGYTDVLAFTDLNESLNVGQENALSVYWVENNSYLPFDAYDLNENGKLDYIEWVVPHLSNQTFEIKYGIMSGSCPAGMSGDGSLGNPCVVTTCLELQNISFNLGASYSLGTDINCSDTINWNFNATRGSNMGFIPLGNLTSPFNGNFDGQNKVISNLFVNGSSIQVGLFGTTSNANIYNVTLSNSIFYAIGNFADTVALGSLVGNSSNSNISNVKINGISDSSKSYNSVSFPAVFQGGLVGLSGGDNIFNCSFNGTVSSGDYAINGQGVIGGLVGFAGMVSSTNIVKSSSSGLVNTNQYGVGGLVGGSSSPNLFMDGLGGFVYIYESFSSANVFGFDFLGGLAGVLGGNATDCYSTGKVISSLTDNLGGSGSGGFVGNLEGNIINSYSTGNVSGAYVAGLVGFNSGYPSSIASSFATGSVTGIYSAAGLFGMCWINAEIFISNSTFDANSTGQSACSADSCYGMSVFNCSAIYNPSYFKGDVYPNHIPMSFWSFPTIWQQTSSYPSLVWQNLLGINNLMVINKSGIIDGIIATGDNLTINATILGSVQGAWITIWQNAINGPVFLTQQLTSYPGNVWSTNVPTNISFPNGIMNYTIYANDSSQTESVNDTFVIYRAVGLTDCGILDKGNTTYTLQNNVSTTGTCFNITADGVTLDLNGFTITGDNAGADIGAYSEGRNNITIKNGNIEWFGKPNIGYGIYFKDTNYSLIKDINSSNNYIGLMLSYSYNNLVSNMTVAFSNFSGAVVQYSNNNTLQNFTSAFTSYPTASMGFIFSSSANNVLINLNSYGHLNNSLHNANFANPNTVIYNNTFGQIVWTKNNLTTRGELTFPGNITIANNSVSFNIAGMSTALNSSANVSIYNLPRNFVNPRIMKDGQVCSDCYAFTSLNAGNVTFNVSSWSNYSIVEFNWSCANLGMAGTGTISDPCIPTTCTHLQNISLNLTASYKLIKNIDCTETRNWNGGKGFQPIDGFTGFSGNVNGQNYSVYNLFINRTDIANVGLFANISNAVFSNLNLRNVNITGQGANIGGLFGSGSGNISFCSVTGNVTSLGSGGSVGGLGGAFSGPLITNSYANANVTALYNAQGYFMMGALLGSGAGRVSYCYSFGNVTGKAGWFGGLIGYFNGYITDSYSGAGVRGSDVCFGFSSAVGGFIGSAQSSTIIHSYSMGSVPVLADQCYPSSNSISGFLGEYALYSDSCYWDKQTSGRVTGNVGNGYPKTTAEMKNQSTFVNWSFGDIWAIDGTNVTNSGYPYLTWQTFNESTVANITQVIVINQSGVSGGTTARGDNITINATISGPVSSAWITLWQNVIGGPVFLIQYLQNLFGNLWSATFATNSSFPLGTMNYTINATDVYGNNVSVNGNFTLVNGSKVYECGTINTSGVYTLQNNISTTSTCFNIAADNVTLDGNGYTISGSDTPLIYGIYAFDVDNITIKNFYIRDFGFFGGTGAIYLLGRNSTIYNNTLYSNDRAIFIQDYSPQNYGGNNLTNNILSANYEGIYVDASSNNFILGNSISYSNSVCVLLLDSHRSIFINNSISNCHIGIDMNTNAENNSLINNLFLNNDVSFTNGVNPTFFIYNNSFGNISFNNLQFGFAGNLTFPGTIQIANNSAYVNSSEIPELNISANVSLYNISYVYIKILKDGGVCSVPNCNILNYSKGAVLFNVSSWSNYTVNNSPLFDSKISSLTRDLVAYYPLDRNITDVVNNFYWSSILPAYQVTGKVGGAHNFDGANQASIPNRNLSYGNSSRTICAWARSNFSDGNYRTIFSYGINTCSYNGFTMGGIGSTMFGGAYCSYISTPSFWEQGKWKQICVDYDGSNLGLYGNGKLLNSQQVTLNTIPSSADPGVGFQLNIGDTQWKGDIDDLLLWNRSLSASEIAFIYNGGFGVDLTDKESILTDCQSLNISNKVYALYNNVTSTGTCFNISADNITLNGNGFTITGDISASGNSTLENARTNLVLNEINLNGNTYSVGANVTGNAGNAGNVNISNSLINGNIYLNGGSAYVSGGDGFGGNGGRATLLNSSIRQLYSNGGDVNNAGGSFSYVGGSAGRINVVNSTFSLLSANGGNIPWCDSGSFCNIGSEGDINLVNLTMNLSSSNLLLSAGTCEGDGICGGELGGHDGLFILNNSILYNSYGSIKFADFSSSKADLQNILSIGNNSAYVNSTNYADYNVSANVTLNLTGWGINSPIILRDGVSCANCAAISYLNNVAIFYVPYWSNYTISQSSINFTNPISINQSGSQGGTVVRGQNVTINVTIDGPVTNAWIKIWQGVIGSPIVLIQQMLNYFGNLWTVTFATNLSFPVGTVNYTIYANGSFNQTFNVSSNFTLVDVTDVTDCRNLDQANTIYTLQNNVSATGTCFNITANNITFNLNGYTITGDSIGADYGIYSTRTANITILNGTVKNFGNATGSSVGVGVYLLNNTNNLVKNMRLINNTRGLSPTANTSASRFENIDLLNNSYGILMGALSCSFENISIDNTYMYGLYLNGAFNVLNNFSNFVISNNRLMSVVLSSSSSNNSFSNFTLINGGAQGVYISSLCNNNIFYDVNSTNSTSEGLYISNSNNNLFVNMRLSSSINITRYISGSNNSFRFNNNFGQISFLPISQDIHSNITFGAAQSIQIANNSAYVNSSAISELNISANVTLYNLPTNMGYPVILKDGTTCTNCYNFTPLNAGNVTFNVFSWSNYTIGDASLLTSCGILDQANTIYTLQNNVSTTGTCFNITANNVTLNLNGFTVSGDDNGPDYGIYSYMRNNIAIFNGSLENFGKTTEDGYGIYFYNTNFSVISKTNVSHSAIGIRLEKSSLNVLQNISAYDGFTGIHLFSKSYYNNLTNINASDNGGVGIEVGSSNNSLNSIIANNNLYYGVFLNSGYNSLSNSVTNGQERGVQVYSSRNIISNASASSNYAGISFPFGSNNYLYDINTSFNQYGVYMDGAINNTLYNLINSYNSVSNFFTSGSNTVLIYNSSYGMIRFSSLNPNSMVFGNFTFPGNIQILNNSVYINLTAIPELNLSANITFYGLPTKVSEMYNASVLFNEGNGKMSCANCNILNSSDSDSSVTFNVSDFGNSRNYSVGGVDVVPLNAGWNSVSFIMDGLTNSSKNISVSAGWNLIGLSGESNVNVDDLNFTNNGGTKYKWSQAVTGMKMQDAVVNYDSSSKRFKIVRDDAGNNMSKGKGYWVYAREAGNLTLPNVRSAGSGKTFKTNELMFRNGSGVELTAVQATDDPYNWISDNAFYWNSNLNRYTTVLLSTSQKINSSSGYFILAKQNNITLFKRG